MTGETALEIEDLHLRFTVDGSGRHPVRGVSLRLERGRTLGLVGESGSGKSLTATAAMNLLPPGAKRSVERITLEGRDITDLDDRALEDLRGNRIAMIFQDATTALDPMFTIGDQMTAVWYRHRNGSRTQAVERAISLLEEVGVTPGAQRIRQYPHQLSGGLRQRVTIAMALMCSPSVLIADEPTTALDATIRISILRLLRDLQQRFNLAVLLVTHDLGVVARATDRTAVMYAGQVVETGPTEVVLRAPAHPYTRALLECAPRAGRGRRRMPLRPIPGVVPTLTDNLQGCAFRNRCALAGPDCALTDPDPVWVGQGHEARCLRLGGPFESVEIARRAP